MKQRVTPQFRMTAWGTSRPFYEHDLSFRVEWEHMFEPGLPVFAEVTLDGLSLFLTEHAGDCEVGGPRISSLTTWTPCMRPSVIAAQR